MPSTGTCRPSARDWTRDAAGKPVDWTAPPYRDGGRLSLVLAHEDPRALEPGTLRRRIAEYYWLARGGALPTPERG